jgi:hypothetical protein
MSQLKKCKVVMLPTNEKTTSNLVLYTPKKHDVIKTILNMNNHNQRLYGGEPDYQYVYILSDNEIKESDWCIDFNCKIFKHENHFPINIGQRKIIATTNKSLGLPQPSLSFIEKYVEEYNKGNIITEVLVEYVEIDGYGNIENHQTHYRELIPKVNPKDNTITIKKVKDSWSREEVEKLLNDLHLFVRNNCTSNRETRITVSKLTKQWIEENL